jgi:hypothetical protein
MQLMLILCAVALLAKIYKVQIVFNGSHPDIASCRGLGLQTDASPSPVLVSYSYFEKDAIQLANMEFFMAVGMGLSVGFERPPNTEFVLVINGDSCRPCSLLQPYVTLDARSSLMPGVASSYSGTGITLLQRTENEGMDFAAHNVRPPCACPWRLPNACIWQTTVHMTCSKCCLGTFATYEPGRPAVWKMYITRYEPCSFCR